MRRMMLGLSQEKLGDSLGLTFQQIQKYEKGTNRIGASRLYQISHILQVPVAFFFEGAPNAQTAGRQEGLAEAPSPAYVSDFPGHRRWLSPHQSIHADRGFEIATADCRSCRADCQSRKAVNPIELTAALLPQ